MRLSEIEEAITTRKCTPELLEQFKTALRRSPKSMQPQHCYTTAAAMPEWCFPMAKELIEYGLDLEGTWLDQMRGRLNLAQLYENRSDYENAKLQYALAMDTIEPDNRDAYIPDCAARMLVCQLHMDNFSYSDDLRRLYNDAQKLDEFNRSFQKCLFYTALAEIILFRRDGDLASARAAYARARTMIQPDYVGPITALLKRKHYIESTGATKEAHTFLRRCARSLR